VNKIVPQRSFKNCAQFHSFVAHIRVAMQDTLAYQDKPRPSVLHALRDLWQLFTDDELSDILRRQNCQVSTNTMLHIQQWEQYLRRRFVERKGDLLPQVPEQPKTAFQYYYQYR
jgi:hypothetical protein